LDDREWQAQLFVGERQTSSKLEYDVNIEETLCLPSATLVSLKRSSRWRLEFL
jgi:hypothetical protein